MSQKPELVYQVRINNRRLIPFFNRLGPILYPVNISEEQYEQLVNRGFDVEILSVIDTKKAAQQKLEKLDYNESIDASEVDTNVAPEIVKLNEEEQPTFEHSTIGKQEVLEEEKASSTSEVEVTENSVQPEAVAEEHHEELNELPFLTEAQIDSLDGKNAREYALLLKDHLTAEELATVNANGPRSNVGRKKVIKDVVARLTAEGENAIVVDSLEGLDWLVALLLSEG